MGSKKNFVIASPKSNCGFLVGSAARRPKRAVVQHRTDYERFQRVTGKRTNPPTLRRSMPGAKEFECSITANQGSVGIPELNAVSTT